MRQCRWIKWCAEPARHDVECETRPGLIVRESVCDHHLDTARRRGYHRTGTASPDEDDDPRYR